VGDARTSTEYSPSRGRIIGMSAVTLARPSSLTSMGS
jgi:hypothetical protein